METKNVLDRQLEIFKNLKNKRSRGSRLGSQDVRALDQTSDYNMAEDIVQPMGELLQTFGNEDDDDEIILPNDDHDDVPKTSQFDSRNQRANRQLQAPQYIPGEFGAEPQQKFLSDGEEKDSDQIKEGDSSEEDEKEDTSNLNITNYDDWLALQSEKLKTQAVTQVAFYNNRDQPLLPSKDFSLQTMEVNSEIMGNYGRSPGPHARKHSQQFAVTQNIGRNYADRPNNFVPTTDSDYRVDYQVG